MKLTNVLFFIFFTTGISLIGCSSLDKTVGSLVHATVKHTKAPIVVDGVLDENDWQNAQPLQLSENKTGAVISDTGYSARAFICHDDTNLYIAFICNDRDIYSTFTQHDDYLWQQEAVEVFIDTDDDPNTYVEIEVSPNNILFDSFIVNPFDIDVPKTLKYNLSGIQTAVTVDGTVNERQDEDRKWNVEISIPFSDLVEKFNPEMITDFVWKINFYRIDADDDGPNAYAWSPTLVERFHNPKRFGTLYFE